MKAPTGSQEHTPIKRDQIYDIPTGLWLKKCIPCSAAIFKLFLSFEEVESDW